MNAYFFSPIAYIMLTACLMINGYIFWMIIQVLNNPFTPHGAALQMFFGGTLYYWLFMFIICPTITMRLLAEEKRSGTIELLVTAPTTATEIILGKYLAALLFFCCLWLPSGVYVAILTLQTKIDLGPILTGYLGTFLLGAVFIAVGLFFSSISKNQIVAAIITFATIILLFSMGLVSFLVTSGWVSKLFSYLNLWEHMRDFSRGILDSRHIFYYLSTILLVILSSIKMQKSHR